MSCNKFIIGDCACSWPHTQKLGQRVKLPQAEVYAHTQHGACIASPTLVGCRDAPRQNCKQQHQCNAMGLHIHRGQAPGFYMVHSLVGTIIALFAAAIAFAPTRL